MSVGTCPERKNPALSPESPPKAPFSKVGNPPLTPPFSKWGNLKAFLLGLFSSSKRPPGPSFTQIRELGEQNSRYWSLEFPLQLMRRYGGISYVSAFKQYLISDADAIQHILQSNASNYQREPFFYGKKMKPMFGNSLLVNEGKYWKNRRRIALPAFNQAAITDYANIITERTQDLIAQWQAIADRKKICFLEKNLKINILDSMTLLTLKIAFEIFCHKSFPDPVLKKLGASIQFCAWYLSQTLIIHPWKPTINNLRFFWHLKKIDRFMLNIIEERRAVQNLYSNTTKDDLLGLLLKAHNTETGLLLSDTEILAEFKTHVITGHETTACGLSWLWYLLAKHPDYQQPMQEELHDILGDRTPTLSDIKKLPLTKAIISESLRLYPPIWTIPRTNIQADTLQGYAIPAKSYLMLHLYALHRNPQYWENPNAFTPERFSKPNPNQHPFSFLPFSAGAHTCIASHFAMTEMLLITATMGSQLGFELLANTKAIPEASVSLRPARGIWLGTRLKQTVQAPTA